MESSRSLYYLSGGRIPRGFHINIPYTHTHSLTHFICKAKRISRLPQPTFHYPNSRVHGPAMNSVVMQTSKMPSLIFLNLNIFIANSLSFYDTLVQR